MKGLPAPERALFYLQIAILLALSLRLFLTGLYRSYRVFFTFNVLNLLQSVVLALIPFRTNLYGYSFMVAESTMMCCYALIILELCGKVLNDWKGIATVSARYIKVTLGIAVIASLLLLGLEATPTGPVAKLFIFERTIIASLVFFILLMGFFLVYYPVPLNRNVIFYSVAYAVYFLLKAVTLLFYNIGYHLTRQMSLGMIGLSTLCLLFWAVALSRKGEEMKVVVGHRWNRADEQRILDRLRAINDSLLQTRQN